MNPDRWNKKHKKPRGTLRGWTSSGEGDMERIDAESSVTVMLIEGGPILRLRRLVGMIILLMGALALLIHGPGLLT